MSDIYWTLFMLLAAITLQSNEYTPYPSQGYTSVDTLVISSDSLVITWMRQDGETYGDISYVEELVVTKSDSTIQRKQK